MKSSETIRSIAGIMRESGDHIHSRQMKELAQKAEEERIVYAFCGHFSAGKSTLINRLCGTSILPSGPVPTSANTVLIRNGESGALIHQKDVESGEGGKLTIPLAELEAACKNGNTIHRIEITYPLPHIGNSIVLMDTPGIDSTDDAHKQATESALHLADVVFYVTDYNHVLSEMNFHFTKRLKDWGKPLYLIINQVDKHREEELPFENFRDTVERTFGEWGIQPDGFLYLSLKETEHPRNEWDRLLLLLDELKKDRENWVDWSLRRSTDELVKLHLGYQLEEQSQRVGVLRTLARGAAESVEAQDSATVSGDYQREEELTEALAKALKKLDELQELPNHTLKEWKKETTAIIENANLIPSQTRDTIGRYLESIQPGFKVGWFGGAKTEQERGMRRNALHEEFLANVKAYLAWHLQDYIRKVTVGQLAASTEDLIQALAAGEVVFTIDWLEERLREGAVYSNEYVMNYSRQLDADTKAVYRRMLSLLLEQMYELLVTHIEIELSTRKIQQAALTEQLNAARELTALHAAAQAYEQHLKQQLEGVLTASKPDAPVVHSEFDLDQSSLHENPLSVSSATTDISVSQAGDKGFLLDRQASGVATISSLVEHATISSMAETPKESLPSVIDRDTRSRLLGTANLLREAAGLLGGTPGTSGLAAAMKDKAERLANSRFTIALFGAFSAGKSSLANALLGERVLPVSPNPTTAAINRIAPPDDKHPHGTVIIKMKTSDYMLEEVNYSLRMLDMPGGDWLECLTSMNRLDLKQAAFASKTHYSFLQAVRRGYAQMSEVLGSQFIVGMDNFSPYASDESKACFVEWLELRYDCPFTRQGAILVDTPGADSVHARHTGVAFDYIKNADAILFVTYYNHAFSQADREFLLQLGRVKDTLELDKMFFLVNAADLATDEEELRGVCQHVETGLQMSGVRNPRIYAISSRLAMEAKLTNQRLLLERSGFNTFEEEFIAFAFGQLAERSAESAESDLRLAKATLTGMIEKAQASSEAREEEIAQLVSSQLTLEARLVQLYSDSAGDNALIKEIDELFFYIHQRFTLRYPELFGLCFNSSTLREDAGDIRQALRTARHELLAMVSYHLSQEVLAASLRVEAFLNRIVKQTYQDGLTQVRLHFPNYPGGGFHAIPLQTPNVAETVTIAETDTRELFQLYKNSRHFFEGGGRARLRQELENKTVEGAAAYLEEYRGIITEYYRELLTKAWQHSHQHLLETIREHVEGMRCALDSSIDIDDLISKSTQLSSWIK